MHRLLSRTVFIYSVDKPEDLTRLRLGLSNPIRLWQMFPSASKLVLWNINRDRVTRAKAETAKEFSRSVMSQARLAHARRGSLQYGGNNDAINCRRVFFARSRNRSTPKFLRPICSFGNNGALSERLRYPGHLDTDNDRLAFPTGKQRDHERRTVASVEEQREGREQGTRDWSVSSGPKMVGRARFLIS